MKMLLAAVILGIFVEGAAGQAFVQMTAKTNRAGKRIGISQFGTTRVEQDSRTETVDVKVHYFGKPAGKYQLQCFFISRNESSLKESIFDAIVIETSNPDLEGQFESLPLMGGTRRFIAMPFSGVYSGSDGVGTFGGTVTSSSVTSGDKIYGWIVRVVENGKVAQLESNQPALKDTASKLRETLDSAASKIAPEVH